MTVVMYDTVDVGTVPPEPEAVAGYVNGLFTNYNALVAKFPRAHHLSIAVSAGAPARCLDIERLDATPEQAPGWLKGPFQEWRAHSSEPGAGTAVLYCSASVISSVTGAMSRARIPRSDYLIWSAHYQAGEHICGPGTCGFPQADGTQWTDLAFGRNLDQSIVGDSFFGPGDPNHYRWFARNGLAHLHGKSELDVVVVYDKIRPQALRRRRQLRHVEHLLAWLAGRVLTVAHDDPNHDGSPSWQKRHRGWRYQQLIHRAHGLKIV